MKKRNASRLASRTRLLYLTISTFTIAVLIVIVGFIANGIANDASQRISRQYSIEAAGNFQAHTNPHITLMLQLARSTVISRWMAYDTDESAKDLAFDEIIGFASYMPDSRFMLTAYRTRNIYDFLPNSAQRLTRDTFMSLGQLPDGEEAQWFFNTRDDELSFNLNIQREMEVQGLDPGTLQMWANKRVYYQGEFVGVVAIGFPFRYIFAYTFGAFDISEMRGYIIDRYGGVRVDSAELMDVFVDGLPTFPVVPETLENPNLAEQIERHLLQRIDGIYQLGAHTFEAIRLDMGRYSHASISPIIGTDWSIVVLSYQPGFFDFQYMPLVYAVALAMVLSLIIGNVMIRRIVITPLLELTESAAAFDITSGSKLYAVDRHDEIGDLSRTIYQAQKELNEMHEEYQRIEIAEEKNKAKSEFIARMSHEIRTPISAVLGISEIGLQTPGLPTIAEESFGKIYSSGKLLLNLINDILDFSKLEGGKMTLADEKYEIYSLINNAANIHYAYLDGKDIKFVLNVDENLPSALIGDNLRIEQVILNVLSNAFKYTDSGSVDLSLNCRHKGADQIDLIISVKDTGLGMSEGQLAVIFDDYTRFHENEKSTVSGTGLGMSIVYNLLQLMNADIQMESAVGKGTTVTMIIPQGVSGADVLGKEAATRLEQFEMLDGREGKQRGFEPEPMPYGKILVVDDIDTNLFVAQGLLAFYSLNVDACTSGRAALDRISRGMIYDIIFMDHMMPELDGVKTMQMLRDRGYHHPIVVLTANALAGQEADYLQSGFDDFMSKPIMTDKLNDVLIKYIKSKQPPEVIEAALKTREIEQGAGSRNIGAYQSDVYVQGKLRMDFAAGQRNTLSRINRALNTGDIETAHLLAHTLKGLAALIREPALSQAAYGVECLLRTNTIPSDGQLNELQDELNHVFEAIEKSIPTDLDENASFDTEKIIALLDELEPLLEQRKTNCRNMIDDLKSIPEAAILVKQIEAFNFQTALISLETFRAMLPILS